MSRSKGYWIKTLSKFVSVQLVVQALGLASGILLVRTLSKEEYALFTLANSMQGMMNVLADSGVSSALSAIGGKVWQDPYRFGQLINTAMRWRRYLAAIAVIVVTPILFLMLVRNGASISYALVIIAGILIELDFYLRIGVQGTVLRLHSQIDRIQRLDLLGASSRVAILGASFSFLNTGIGIFSSTIASGLQALTLSRWTREVINIKVDVNKSDQDNISKIVVSQVPNAVFFCIQGQLTVWLISVYGNTQSIAEVGALGRVGAIFAVAGSVMANIILPGFSRLQSNNSLLKAYLSILMVLSLFGALLVGFSIFLPAPFLWILGNKYTHLKEELVLAVINLVFSYIVGNMWSINSSRAWINYSWINIPLTIMAQVFLLTIIDASTVKGALLFSILSSVPAFIINCFLAYRGLSSYTRSNLTL